MCLKLLLSFLILFLFGCSDPLKDITNLYQKTSTTYEKILRKNPQNISLTLKLAKFYYEFKDFNKVIELTKDIDNKEAKMLLAKSFVRIKDFTSALEVFEQLGELDDSEYLYLYAQALEEKNLYPKAILVYKKVRPPFKELAEERIKKIGIRIEEGVPEFIEKLVKENEDFISKIQKEELVIIYVNEKFEVKKENSAISELHMVKKILKEKGKDLAEIEIGYDSTYEKVELEYARTITPFGKVVYAGKENIRDVSKYLNFPLYSNARALIVSMPSVEVGSIIEYKVKIYSSKLINDKNFSFVYRLKERYPIAKAEFKLIVPKNFKANFKFLNQDYLEPNINLNPKIEEDSFKITYSLKFEKLQPIVPEELMPPFSFINPAIIISNFNSWQEIYNWWFKLYKDKLVLDKEIKNFVKELIKDAKDDLEKAKRIYEFCTKEIRYVAVEYGESGYEPHKASDIFWNRYGDCKDKSILLIAMLKEIGLKSYPVLIPTREVYPISEDFPSLNFNHAIAVLVYEDKLIFMDPTSTTVEFKSLPLDDQGRKVLIFFDDGYKITTTPFIEKNEIIYDMDIKIDFEENAFFKRKITTCGFFSAIQRYYLKYTHPQVIEDDLKNKIKSISPFSQLLDYSIENADDFDKNPILEYNFKTIKFLNPANNLRVLPYTSDIDIDVGCIGKEKRNYPLDFVNLYKKISKIKIELPSSLKLKYLPENKEINNKWFDFKAVYKSEKNCLEFYKEFVIKERLIPLEDYLEFKKNLEDVIFLLREEVILEKYEEKK